MDKIKSHNKDPAKLAGFIKDDSLIDSASVYSAIVYNTKTDRDGDKVTVEHLKQMQALITGKPVFKDHNIATVENIVGRVYDAHVENDELIADFYVTDDVVKQAINSGIYYNMSLRYSIDDDKITDVYEVSFVGIPAVREARVKNHDIGGIDDMSVEELTKENEELKAKLADLEKELEEIKSAELVKESAEVVEKLVEEEVKTLEPCNDDVKGYMVEDIMNSLCVDFVEDGTEGAVKTKSGHAILVSGIPEAVEAVKTKYFKMGVAGKPKKEQTTREKGLKFSNTDTKSESVTTRTKGIKFNF